MCCATVAPIVNSTSPGWAAMAMILVGIQMVLYHSPCQGVAVAAWIGPGAQDTLIDDDRGGGAERPAALHLDLMAALLQFTAHAFRNAILDRHLSGIHRVREFGGREARRRPARRFDGFLNIHAEVHDIQQSLRDTQRLIVTAG